MTTIRFIKRFVLFADAASLVDGRLVSSKNQYHVKFGEYHKVSVLEQTSPQTFLVEFAEEDKFQGSARLDKDTFEIMTPQVLSNNCCKERN
jgi:hypothetical protein